MDKTIKVLTEFNSERLVKIVEVEQNIGEQIAN